MKILSNFDTKLAQKLLSEYGELFGQENVMVVHKSRLFYYQHIGVPWFSLFVVLCLGFYVVYGLDEIVIWAEIGFWLLVIVLCIIVTRKTIGHYINYKMDFLVVTPHEIIKYDQNGIFGRAVEKLQVNKIKSISTQKSGIVNSIFDIGSLHLMAEGDTEKGDIMMSFVDAVDSKERNIVRILGIES